jgi:hypothetical protein
VSPADTTAAKKPSIMFLEEERILPVQEVDGKLKAKQENFIHSEVMVVMMLMTMITLCGQSLVFQIKFCMGESRMPVHTYFAWNRDEGFSFL